MHTEQEQNILCKDRPFIAKLKKQIKNQQNPQQKARLEEKLQHVLKRSAHIYQKRQNALPKITLNQKLPIYQHAQTIKDHLKDQQVLIISGETGSGKTTQLPQICLEAGFGIRGCIAHTQPRRIAARSIAARIAEETQSILGKTVGYHVRFDEKYDRDSAIKLMTDGMLLAETLNDKYLNNYEVIIIDEAHERSLNIDFLLGYLKKILPKRPDLKIIITSATIDSEKFSHHFNNAPIIQVSGRSYPVEILYRPYEKEEQNEAISKAIDELDQYEKGDILIFFATEREILDCARHLRQTHHQQSEILPLFARLTPKAQHKIFHPEDKRRIILSTNIAETSLTVPRIRYVIDTGFARISRYSLKSKTQRLPIEAISQAAAQQRAGRCGRLSHGICIRLYSEEDYQQRPSFSEPEILRTNLSAVLLQMLTLKLGEIENFPFVESPDNRQINDGYRLLYELQAVDENKKLTPMGRKMAHLPIDPRFARILHAGEKNACLHETIILLAALSLQDPRERPIEHSQIAEQRQNEFQNKNSDFQTLLNLFIHYHRQRKKLSQKQLKTWCAHYHLNHNRMREWRELAEQLLREAKEQHLKINTLELHTIPLSHPEYTQGAKSSLDYQNPNLNAIHRALMTGFLDQVGLWDEKNKNYLGTRQRKLHIFPTSALAKTRPQAILCANILELNRIYALYCAKIELHELVPLCTHLSKKHQQNPHWSKKQGNVIAEETISLYGLPISAGHKVPYYPTNPELAHQIFIQEALITGEIQSPLKFIKHNLALYQKINQLENKTRQKNDHIDETQLAEFYQQQLPQEVHSRVSLEKWVKKHGEQNLYLNENTLKPLLKQNQHYPEHIDYKGTRYKLSYRFDPSADDDGITLHLPLDALNRIEEDDFSRLIPAMLENKIEAQLRALPKRWRRELMPIPEFAHALHERLKNDPRPLPEALQAEIKKIKGSEIPIEHFHPENLEKHHRINYRLINQKGKIIAESRELSALKNNYSAKAKKSFQKKAEHKEEVIHDWQWENFPEKIKISDKLYGYPAITKNDENTTLTLRLYDSQEEAERIQKQGLIALFSQKLNAKLKYINKNIKDLNRLTLIYRQINKEEKITTALNSLIIERSCLNHGLPKNKQDYQNALKNGEQTIILEAQKLTEQLINILNLHQKIKEQRNKLKNSALQEDLERQIKHLIFPNFLHETPNTGIDKLPRYLEGIIKRLEKYQQQPQKDQERLEKIKNWQEKLERYLKQQQLQTPYQARKNRQALLDYFYGLQEYRLQCFAQELKAHEKISEKILEQRYEKLNHS